jgi:hypothetical protein
MSIFSRNKITINGKSYDNVGGKNIQVRNDSVYVDGQLIESGLSGIVKIEFTGDIANLDCTTAHINGNVTGNVDGTTINCGNVGGDVDGTTIRCGNIGGNVDGVTINCNTVKGNIKF